MKLHVEVAVICLAGFLSIHRIFCDESSNVFGTIKWTCACLLNQGNQNSFLSSNCSASCNCTSAGGEKSENMWTCRCMDNFPKIASVNNDTNCFTACNCTAGCFYKAAFLVKHKSGTVHGILLQFAYSELEHATNYFSSSNLIGLGGSSYVYRGQLKDGRIVAIKRLKHEEGPDADLKFSTEVDLLSRLHHCHVVPLLGYCSEFQGKHVERLLVFEFMLNGNLRDCLDGTIGENMGWDTRVGIAIGAARGLEYLHEAAAPRILHRDVKSTNILLDENWRAKITDLGMAKCLKADDLPSGSNSPARMQGTFGYFAPEYAIVGRASLKSDVFSFGVVLLELITGRHPIHKSTSKGEESLVIWATPRLQDSGRVISDLPDPRLKGNFPEEEMYIMAYLAKECLLLDPDSRPTMSEVVQILSTIAPDKSRMRNIQASLFQWSSASMKSDLITERPGELVNSPIDAEELKNIASNGLSSPCSLPVDVGQDPWVANNENDISSTHVERLILLSSKARSWRSHEDDTVDLVEPRLESFCLVTASPLEKAH
ncbi:receptor-like serine/threonine-protein kinase NCRK isoform X3 [Syzygium oleosum]|uniref:receptor-like serine/threonine-protein kinase NCRK isoform X3 n=1 Tax=Syzygium oleosum TaxID=219896 RepID=UPI0024B88311|nr:receptor-like serine/threonine-protein kinase NCRK isoform X3 [Syzygium oleosum]